MKKIALSTVVILFFAIYAFHQRQENSGAIKNIVPNTPALPIDAGNTQSPVPQTHPSRAAVISTNNPTTSGYIDGEYTGIVADAFYGNIQVKAIISGGKIADVQFLQYPNDRRTSIEINTQAMPYLKQEAIAAQSVQVDGVSGATDTSRAFVESLGSALAKAKS